MYLQLSYLLLCQVELANFQQGGFGARGRPRPCKPLTHNEEYYEVEVKSPVLSVETYLICIKYIFQVQSQTCQTYRSSGRRVTHEGFVRPQPSNGSTRTRARHTSLPRGKSSEEGGVGKKIQRTRHSVSLAPDLRIGTSEEGALLSKEVGGELPLIGGHCENEKKEIGRESLAKWKRQIESDEAVIQQEILTPLSRLPEEVFEETCTPIEENQAVQSSEMCKVNIEPQELGLASGEIFFSLEECDCLATRDLHKQVEMRPLMEEPNAFLAVEHVPVKLIGLNSCHNFPSLEEEKSRLTVKKETGLVLIENSEIKVHTVDVIEHISRKVGEFEVIENSEVGKVEVSKCGGEVARLRGKSENGNLEESESFSETGEKEVGHYVVSKETVEVKEGEETVDYEEGLCLSLIGMEVKIARLAATITKMPGQSVGRWT